MDPDIDISRDDLAMVDLSGADLSNADLSGAKLLWARLMGADLSGANLTGANLARARLSKANLKDANLTRANLYNAALNGANLEGADLTGAKMEGVALTGAYRPHDIPPGWESDQNGRLRKDKSSPVWLAARKLAAERMAARRLDPGPKMPSHGYKMACPNCGSKKIRGRIRRQELFCGDCGQVWESPFLLKREHLVSGNKLAFAIKYDGIPKDISSNTKREWDTVVSLVSESDGVLVYECGACHQRFTDDSEGDGFGVFDEARNHYINTHGTAQLDSDG